MNRERELLEIAKRIRAMSQTGLVYVQDEYDRERYEEFVSLSDKITSLLTDYSISEIQANYLPVKEYVTPKVDIRAIVFNDKNEILLVREKADGLWSVPGGWSDVGYSPSEVAVKEVKEETGLDVEASRLLAVLDMRKHNHPVIPFYVYKFFILCDIKGGAFDNTFDILDKGFFALDNLPPLSEERVLASQIEKMLELKNNPANDVIFD